MNALFCTTLEHQVCRCDLCPHHCILSPGHTGRCRTRYNNTGQVIALNYGQCTSIALDPIEKKPLRYFHPGTFILSLGSWGCNMTCSFCQNWAISQGTPPVQTISPQEAAALACTYRKQGNIGLAYTYNEPVVWYEFIYDTAPLIHKAGLYNVVVTNGFIEEAPLEKLLPYIDAWNIDLKSFQPDFYTDLCGASRDAVCRTIKSAARSSHVEVTNLIIPGKNDDPASVGAMARWLAAIRPDIPLHLSRYFPRYRMKLPPTPLETLQACADEAKKYLSFVHIGNI